MQFSGSMASTPGGFLGRSANFASSVPGTVPALAAAAAVASPGAGAASATNAAGQTTLVERSHRNLKIGGLPAEITDSDLVRLFEKYGKIESAKVMLNVNTAESRGYGFVLFDTPEAGCRAFGEANGQRITLYGKTFQLDVKFSDWDGKQAAAESNSIYVRNIPNNLGDDDLRDIFARFGSVINLITRLQAPAGSTASRGVASGGGASPAAAAGGASAAAHNGSLASLPWGATPPHVPPHVPSMVQQLTAAANAAATAASPPDGASGDEGALAGGTTPPAAGGPALMNKLAHVEYATVDEARRAINGIHRQDVFPGATTPALAKFAEAPEIKEQRRQQRKRTQQQVAAAAVQQQHAAVAAAAAALHHIHRQPHPLGAAGALHPHGPPPPHPQQANVAASAPMTLLPPQFQLLSGGAGAPNGGAILFAPPAMQNAAGAARNRFPDQCALPLPQLGGYQRIFFNGVLGLTPDGVLYPIRVDHCQYVTSPAAAAAATSPAPPIWPTPNAANARAPGSAGAPGPVPPQNAQTHLLFHNQHGLFTAAAQPVIGPDSTVLLLHAAVET